MRIVPLPPNVLGVDTIESLSPYECRALVNLGYKFREGYLDAMTPQEVQGQLSADLPLILYTYANQFDPEHALLRCKALGAPQGACVVLDVEALPANYDPQKLCDEIDAWGSRLRSQALLACMYFATGSILTSAELYAREVFRYHAGASDNLDRFDKTQDPIPRGCAMIQGRPCNFTIDAVPGKKFDADFHRQDYKGDVFSAMVA